MKTKPGKTTNELDRHAKLLGINSAARYMSIAPRTVQALLSRRELQPVKIGRRTLIDRADLDRLIETRKGAGR